MKWITLFILFLFVLFLSTPTLVRLVENNSSISMCYDFSEEENSKDIKEFKDFKGDLRVGFDYPFIVIVLDKTKVTFDKGTNLLNLANEIFIPPPELI